MKSKLTPRTRLASAALAILSVVQFGVPGQAADCISTPAGQVGWWKAESNALDSAGANNGTLAGSGVTFANGKVGQGFRFDGTNGYVQIPDSNALKPANVTCEAWVWLDPNLPPNRGGEQIVFKKNTWSAWFEGYSLLKITLDNGNGTFSDRFQFCVSRFGNQVIINSQTIAQRGVWYHVAATYDGNQSKLYVNGVLEVLATPGFALDYDTTPIFIGTSGTWAPYLSMFGGIIDEPSIYNRALAASEIAAIYNVGSAGKCAPLVATNNCVTPPSGIVSWWKAEGNALDAVGGNGGVLLGGATFAGGEAGQAFAFNGTSSYVQVADTAALRLTSELTIEFWARRQQVGGPDYLVNKGGDWTHGGLNYGVAIAGNDFNNIFHFLFAGGVRGTISITDLNWHHYAVTARHGDADPVFYVDGVLQTVTYHQGAAAINLYPSTQPLNIGAQLDPTFNYFGHALIDELGIYNRILSAAEIQSIYTAGSAGKCAPVVVNNCVPPPSGIVSWWKAEGNAQDVAGGNNGTLFNGAATATGEAGQAFSFDGVNDYVKIPKAANLDVGNQVTVEFWMKADAANAMNTYQGLVTSDFFGIEIANGYVLGPLGVSFFLSTDGGASVSSSSYPDTATVNGGGAVVTAGQWHHVAGTYDGTKLQLYIDGAPWGNPNYHTGAISPMLANSFVAIGSEDGRTICPGCVSSRYFNGLIDEATIYNRALSLSEIQSIYNAGSAGKCVPATPTNNCVTPPTGMVSWWKGEQNTLDLVSSNNGVAINGAVFTGGVAGQAFSFNGTNSYVEVPDSSSLRLTDTLSIEFWVKRQRLNGPYGEYIINKGGDWTHGQLNYGVGLALPAYGSILQFLFAGGNRGCGSIADSNWHHCAIIAHNGDVDPTFYIDGVLQPITYREGASTINLYPSTAPLRIGAQIDSTFNYFGQVLIDELTLYSRALTADEVQAIYIAGSAGKCVSASSGPPAISSFSPASAAPGSVVTISGNNFSPAPANNIVYFGAVKANVLSATTTSLTVSVPLGATFAPITVTVNGRVAFASRPFEPSFVGNGLNLTTGSFAPGFNLSSGSGPNCMVIADLDGDGKPDLAQVNYYAQTISLYRNLGNGGTLSAASFAARVDLPLPGGANSGQVYRLRVADLDGDGRLDLIVAEAAGSRVSIFRNVAAPGSLTPASFEPPFSISAGHDARFATAADLDGDARADLISLNYADNTISIFKNIGAGGGLSSNSFAAPVNLNCAAGPYEVAVGDLDGDGKPDLAVVNSSANVISVFRNTTTTGTIDASSFALRVDFPSQTGGDTIAIGDLDGDGKLDLVVGFYLPSVFSVFRNVSTPGSFTTSSLAAPVDFSLPGRGHTVALADFNGDGKPDITVVGELPDYMSVFQNNSTPGSFTGASLAARVDFGTGWNAWNVAAGDLDGDGRPDVVFCNQYDATLTLYQNQVPFGGSPQFTLQPANQSVTVGNNVTFTALAAGSDPLSYQWQFNGTNISNATNTSLAVFNVQLDQAGNYSVLVTNPLGSTTSSNALLTVNPAICLAPPAGLVGWWSAESNVLDHVSGNHGTLEGGATFAPGKIGQGFRFDGVNGYVQIPDSALLKPAHVTVEAWVWLDPNVNTGPGAECIIFKRNSWTFLFEGYNLAKASIDTGNGTYSERFFFVITRDGNQVIINSTTVAQRGVWYHVAATYDGNQATLFVNGVAEASASPGFALDYGDRPIFIGTSGEPAPYTSMFAGIIDEPSIYARALSTNEIAALYTAGNADKCNVPVAPTIVVQPQDTAALFGGTALFNVAAGGTQLLSYQWNRNSSALVGETNSSLTLSNVDFSLSGGLYSVTITNAGGSVTSSNAVLTVLNTPPQISASGDQQVSYIAPPQTFAFTVSDAESPASSLQVTASSSNTNLVPNEQIVLSGTDTNRTLTLTPITNQLSTTTITLTVVDPGGQSNQTSFVFTVINNTPQVSLIASLKGFANQPTAPIAFNISDVETPADQLILTATSSNTNTVPTNNIVFAGTGTNHTVTITPLQTGVSTIVVRATDALGATGSRSFSITVDQFTQLTNNIPSLSYSTVAWGDYDNDGKLDLLVTGTTNSLPSGAITRIYHNDGGVFTNFISLTGVFKSAAAWADYDRDGFLDVLISGLTSSNIPITRVYHNNGNGTFTDINAGLTACYSGTVAWGDFNNDGAPDIYLSGLVTTTNGTTAVTSNIFRMYRNDGGVFTDINVQLAYTSGILGPNNGTASWGDYDNDGRLDLLLVGQATTIIYRNLGNGTFSNAFSSAVISGSASGAGAWGDYDNDGWLDFAVSGSSASTIIFHNNRNGTFSQVASLSSGTTPSVAWGDYDNDGDLDLLVGTGGTSRLYRNNGNGTFTDTVTTLPASLNGAVAWGDFDNDGRLDITFVGGKATLLRNNNGSANTPPAPPNNLASTLTASNSVILAWSRPLDSQTYSNGLNYNLRVGTTQGGIDVVSPQADPVTGQRRVVALGNVGPTNRALLPNLPKGTYYWSAQAIDTAFAGSPFASEGTFDITNARPSISDIADQIIAPGTNAPGPLIPFVIGDLETGASNLVLTARSSNTNVVALTNIVFGGFGSNRTVRVAARTNGTSVITVTVTDAQGAFASDNFTVRAEQFTLLSTNFVRVQNSFVAWGDYDNDGDLDVVIAGNTNGITTLPPVTQLYRNDGNGVFTPVASAFPNVTLGSAAWGDYDNDGRLDLLITGSTNGSANGRLSRIYHNNGDGTFTDINAGLPGVFYSAVAWGDYDNDGRADVFITGTTNGTGSGTISRIYRNNGDGTFSNAVSLAGIYLGAVAWADFDGDGDLDIVVTGMNSAGAATTVVYRNNGNGTFTQAASLTGVYNSSVAVGDYDNDGRPDILLAGYTGSSAVSIVYHNDGNFSFFSISTGLLGARQSSVAWGDFDNDGRLDILISGTSTTGLPLSTGAFTRVYRNTGSNAQFQTFINVPVNLPTNYSGTVTWADFDNDGKLDILLTGTDGVLDGLQTARSQTMLFRNNNSVSNTPPTAPATLSAVRSNNIVALTWAKSTDVQTRTIIGNTATITNYDGLKYQIRVGTTPGGLQTESPLADLSNGYRRVVRIGDASTNRWQLLNLPPGTYYWSVQAIDTEFAGSPFAAESSFFITHPPVALPDAVATAINTPANFAAAKLTLNDTDADGDPLTVISVSDSTQGGKVSLLSGRVTYNPPQPTLGGTNGPTSFTGNDTFIYTISDGQGGTAVGTVTVTVGNGGLISLNIIYGPLVDGGDFVVRFAGIPGFTYTIEAANSLGGPWTKVSNLTAPTTDTGFGIGVFEFREPMGANSARFYRTVYPSY